MNEIILNYVETHKHFRIKTSDFLVQLSRYRVAEILNLRTAFFYIVDRRILAYQ